MILLVDLNKEKLGLEEFVLPFKRIVEGKGLECRIRHYADIKNEWSKAEKIIFCGTPLKDNEYLERLELFEWVKECGVPLLGVCSGMHLIASVYGSSLTECAGIGLKKVRIVKECKLFSSGFKAYFVHSLCPAIDSKGVLRVLAKDKECVQAFKHKEKEVYGLLFHPEARNKEIVERFLGL